MSTPEPIRERAPTLQGRYRLVRTTAVTELATRFLGYDLRLHRWRAIDVPLDDLRSKVLLQESEMLARLEHPAVERVIDVGEDGPITFVVRDPLHGCAIDHLPMSPRHAVAVVSRLADGLSHAHARGILHGTVRPSAIRFSEDGGAVLVGFGRQSELDPSTTSRSSEPWAHVAPETRRSGRCDVASEVYALSATLYTLIAGRHQADLFYAEAYDGMMTAIPNPLRPVIYAGCAYTPAERPRDVDGFRSLLAARLEALGSPSAGDPPWRPEPLPDQPPESIVPDRHIQVLVATLRSWGAPEAARRTHRSDPEDSSSTLHTGGTPNGVRYEMPGLHRKDPGFRDPFEPHDPRDVPEYIDPNHPLGLVPQPPVRFTVRDIGATPPTPTPAPRRGLGQATMPILSGLALALAALAVVIALSVSAFAWVATAELRADRAFVDAVSAERAWVERLASESQDRAAIEDAWFRFDDQPTAAHAEAFVRAALAVGQAETAQPEARSAVKRLQVSLARWEGATRGGSPP